MSILEQTLEFSQTRRLALFLFSLGVAFWLPNSAFGLADLGVETTSFFRKSNDRATNHGTAKLGLKKKHDYGFARLGLDVGVDVFLSDTSAAGVRSKDFFLATKKSQLGSNEFSLGIRKFDWSVVDDTWKIGTWSPRYLWDPLHPEQNGLAGAYYKFENSDLRIIFYGTGFSTLEQGYPIRAKNGKLTAASPFWIPPPERVDLGTSQANINYSIKQPKISDILLRPAAAATVRVGGRKGFWGSGSYGYMPLHQPDLAFEAELKASTGEVEATVHPNFFHHHIATIESGYRSKKWNFWGSATGDIPENIVREPRFIAHSIGKSLLGAGGVSHQFTYGISAFATYLKVYEDKPPLTQNLFDPDTVNLPRRYDFSDALKVGGAWKGRSALSYQAAATYDFEFESTFYTGSIVFVPKWNKSSVNRWQFLFGVDIIGASDRQGWIGRYRGDDRFRGGVSYAL